MLIRRVLLLGFRNLYHYTLVTRARRLRSAELVGVNALVYALLLTFPFVNHLVKLAASSADQESPISVVG